MTKPVTKSRAQDIIKMARERKETLRLTHVDYAREMTEKESRDIHQYWFSDAFDGFATFNQVIESLAE